MVSHGTVYLTMLKGRSPRGRGEREARAVGAFEERFTNASHE